MARRFLLNQRIDQFQIFVNNNPIPESENLENVEFIFPSDYREDERLSGLTIADDGWGVERLTNGREIRWQFRFYKDPIDEEELRGVAVFIKKKIAQQPFLFNLVGGLHGQAGVEYLSGQVKADYLDELSDDIISTERQRINWEHEESLPLLEWGQERIKTLLGIWKKRRLEEKEKIMMDKISPFSKRIEKLVRHERPIVTQALRKLAVVSKIKTDEFLEIGNAVLTAWEGGRLKGLIYELSTVKEMSDEKLLEILLEAKVLTALHTAEAVKAKINTINGLEERINKKELEPAVRDFIAEEPRLISPIWETFKKETRVTHLIGAAAKETKLDDIDDFKGRVDLVMSSGETLLIVEFMRPGLTLDMDHLNRFEEYIFLVRNYLKPTTLPEVTFSKVVGNIIADKLYKKPQVAMKIEELRKSDMFALDWETLLRQAYSQWKDFLNILQSRAPEDERLKAISIDVADDITTSEVNGTLIVSTPDA